MVADFLKDYEPVEDRLRAFWKDWPDGRVVTVLVSHADGQYLVRAEVFRTDDGLPAASGLAEERETQRGVNSTSALENCETSAIGRALANLGYAAKGKRPSREEMSKTSGAEAAEKQPVATGQMLGQDPAPGTTSPVEQKRQVEPGIGDAAVSASPTGGTTSTDGEAVGEAPGEGQPKPSPGATTKDAPGPPHYPLTPAECSHLNSRSGRLLGPRSSPRGPVCPRCGLSYITVTESTSADLGSA